MLWTHSLVKCPDGYKVIRLTTVRNESETQRNLRFNLFVTTKTKPFQKRFSSRITRLVKTTWKLINFLLARTNRHSVSHDIFYFYCCIQINIMCSKNRRFFPSCLGSWQVFGACQYFPSPWRWPGQTVIFSIRSSVISNKSTLADIKSFSDTLSLKRWC